MLLLKKNIKFILRSCSFLVLLRQAVNLCKVMFQVVRVDAGRDACNFNVSVMSSRVCVTNDGA